MVKHVLVGMFALRALALTACGGDVNEEDAAVEPAVPSISIVSPATGSDIEGGSILVRIAAMGVDIVAAGTEQANSGHHHLFLNREPTPVGETIPAEEGIVHLGGAQLEYEFTDLEPGVYTITAVLGDYLHVRIGQIEPSRVTVTVN